MPISTPAAHNPIPSVVNMNATNESVVHNDISLFEPPFKRQRTEESQDASGDVEINCDSPIRDEQYYMESEGADCVILAGSVLFKVHRFILCKDSSAFRNMFSLPPGCGEDGLPFPREGSSDENPIVLQEDADHFRALLWCLYSLPRDLQHHQGPSGDLNLLVKLAMMTHKYHFASTEAWTLDAICSVMSRPSPIWENSPTLSLILGIAVLCDHEPLRELVISTWVPRLLSGILPPIPAMIAADRYELPQLQGAAYYIQVLEMDRANTVFIPPSDHELSRDQLVTLLSGHWAMVKQWECIQNRPISFQRSNGCTMHAHGCIATWNAKWNKYARSEKTLRYPSVDVLGRLQCLYEQIMADEIAIQQLTPGCRTSALRALCNLILAQKSTLVEFFVDRTRSIPGSPKSP